MIDIVFFSSNLLKLADGGWVPLVPGAALIAMMTSWQRGRALLFARWRQDSMPLVPFLVRLPSSRIERVPGQAIFLTGNPDYLPGALLHHLKHNKILHRTVLFVNVRTEDVPEIVPKARADVTELSPISTESLLYSPVVRWVGSARNKVRPSAQLLQMNSCGVSPRRVLRRRAWL